MEGARWSIYTAGTASMRSGFFLFQAGPSVNEDNKKGRPWPREPTRFHRSATLSVLFSISHHKGGLTEDVIVMFSYFTAHPIQDLVWWGKKPGCGAHSEARRKKRGELWSSLETRRHLPPKKRRNCCIYIVLSYYAHCNTWSVSKTMCHAYWWYWDDCSSIRATLLQCLLLLWNKDNTFFHLSFFISFLFSFHTYLITSLSISYVVCVV